MGEQFYEVWIGGWVDLCGWMAGGMRRKGKICKELRILNTNACWIGSQYSKPKFKTSSNTKPCCRVDHHYSLQNAFVNIRWTELELHLPEACRRNDRHSADPPPTLDQYYLRALCCGRTHTNFWWSSLQRAGGWRIHPWIISPTSPPGAGNVKPCHLNALLLSRQLLIHQLSFSVPMSLYFFIC